MAILHKVTYTKHYPDGKRYVELQCGHDYLCDPSVEKPHNHDALALDADPHDDDLHDTLVMRCPKCDELRRKRFLQ